jgi:hypothetical protein
MWRRRSTAAAEPERELTQPEESIYDPGAMDVQIAQHVERAIRRRRDLQMVAVAEIPEWKESVEQRNFGEIGIGIEIESGEGMGHGESMPNEAHRAQIPLDQFFLTRKMIHPNQPAAPCRR